VHIDKVGAEQHPPVVLRPPTVGAEQHRGDRGLQIVVLHMHHGDTAELGERRDMPFQERLLRLGGEHPMHRPAGKAQPHREQVTLRPAGRQIDEQFREVDLTLRGGLVGLRDVDLRDRPAGLRPDLPPPLRDKRPQRRIRQPGGLVFVDQPVQHPHRGVTLLARGRQIRPQHRIDRVHERVDLAGLPLPPGRCRWRRRGQRLPHRSALHPMAFRQRPHRQALHPGIPPDLLEQHDLGPHVSS